MGQTLRARRRAKDARYEQFQALLDQALEAGRQAASDMPDRQGPAARRGTVRVKLDDGRTSFGRFVHQEHHAEWRSGRRQGQYLPVAFADFDKAVAYAEAMREVLMGAGIGVTIETQYVSGPEEPDA